MTTTVISVRDLSPACQDYLRSIYVLSGSEERVSISALAGRMGVTAPSATAMSKRLAAMGLVERVPYRGLSLTDEGRNVALELLRHHRLIERYLADTLGLPLDAVHDEADRLEHALSEELEARIDERLGFPAFDPHGDPIPDRDLQLAPAFERRTIVELTPGERGDRHRGARQRPGAAPLPRRSSAWFRQAGSPSSRSRRSTVP